MRVLSFDMGTRNMAFALIDAPQTIVRMGMIDLQKHAARNATETLVDTMATDNAWMVAETCPVVIELQPRAGICKVLSHVLQAIFLTHNRQRLVQFVHAKQKFDFSPGMFAETPPQDYAERKALAVSMAQTVLAGKFRAFFDGRPYKQQTDLADAIVQGCAWLQKH